MGLSDVIAIEGMGLGLTRCARALTRVGAIRFNLVDILDAVGVKVAGEGRGDKKRR